LDCFTCLLNLISVGWQQSLAKIKYVERFALLLSPMARTPTLKFDRGTLILHPPPKGKAWVDFATWDDRIERFRVPALHYRALIEALRRDNTQIQDDAAAFAAVAQRADLQRSGLGAGQPDGLLRHLWPQRPVQRGD
jgi:hypothetical protein